MKSWCKTITFKETSKLTLNSFEGLEVYKHAHMRVYSPCDVGMAKSCTVCAPFTSHTGKEGQGVSHLSGQAFLQACREDIEIGF